MHYVSDQTLWGVILSSLAMGLLMGFIGGYLSCEKHWRRRSEWLLGQRTVEQQMHRDGWWTP